MTNFEEYYAAAVMALGRFKRMQFQSSGEHNFHINGQSIFLEKFDTVHTNQTLIDHFPFLCGKAPKGDEEQFYMCTHAGDVLKKIIDECVVRHINEMPSKKKN